MGLSQFFQDVRGELHEILWNDVLRGPREKQRELLERELVDATTQLRKLRTAVDELSRDLADKERRADRIEAHVHVYLNVADRANAWRHALELDRLRQTLAVERTRLQRRRQAYERQRTYVRRLQDQLDEEQFDHYAKG